LEGSTTNLPSIDQLLTRAQQEYSDPRNGLTLIAIPSGERVRGQKVRLEQCDKDSPDLGQIRNGVFYWPVRCSRHFGSASVEGLGNYIFIGLDNSGVGINHFHDFGCEA